MRQMLRKLRFRDYTRWWLLLSTHPSGVAPPVECGVSLTVPITAIKSFYLHPLFEEPLSETLWRHVFQTNVIKLPHYYAGVTTGGSRYFKAAMTLSTVVQQ